jgi:hypothetical protein
MKWKICGLFVMAGMLAMAAPSTAHHAVQAEFNMAKIEEFSGVLTRVAFINPHPRWFFDVKNPDGTITKFEVTAGGGAGLLRAKSMVRDFKIGETYRITYAPAWSGRPIGRLRDIYMPDGKVITIFHADPANATDN